MGEEIKLWYLENITIFKHLRGRELDFINSNTLTRRARKNEFIYFPEDPSSTIYFLKKGRVKIGSYSSDGRELIRSVLQPGEVFGELSLVGEEKREDFAQAMDSDVLMCAMQRDAMLRMMESSTALSLKVTRLIGLRLRRMERRLESVVFKDTKTRVLDFIKEMAEESGRREGDTIVVEHRLTHQDIGCLTATSRQTVTTILNELKEQGYIDFDRTRIFLKVQKGLGNNQPGIFIS